MVAVIRSNRYSTLYILCSLSIYLALQSIGYAGFGGIGEHTSLTALLVWPSVFLAFHLIANGKKYVQSFVKLNVLDLAFLAFLSLLSLKVTIASQNGYSQLITDPHVVGIIQNSIFYVVGRTWVPRGKNKMLLLAFFACSSLMAVFVRNTEIGSSLGAEYYLYNYQGVALAYLILTFLVMFDCAKAIQNIVFLMAIFTLFVNGARSELVALIVSYGLLQLQYLGRLKGSHLIFFMLIILAIIFVYDMLQTYFPYSRIWGLLSLAGDDSLYIRGINYTEAIDTIFLHPIWGDYGSYVPGTYAHNILSAWVDTGILGFALLVFLYVYGIMVIVRRFPYDRQTAKYGLLLISLFSGVLLLIAAKFFVYPLTGLVVGLIRSLENQKANYQGRTLYN